MQLHALPPDSKAASAGHHVRCPGCSGAFVFLPRPVVLLGPVAPGQLLEVLRVHAVHDRVVRGHRGDAEAEEPSDPQGHGKRCRQTQSLPGRQVC